MRINTCRTLEDQIRKLKRDMTKIERAINEMREDMNKRFDGLENKLGQTFNVIADGFKATGHDIFHNEIKEIWKDSI